MILALDGISIGDDGTFDFRNGERIYYSYLVTSKFSGDSIKATVWRKGKQVEVTIPLSTMKAAVVPFTLYENSSSYFIFGGLVFAPLSRPLLRSEYGKGWHKKAPINLCEMAYYDVKQESDEQIVLLQQILSHEVNNGYQLMYNTVVKQCQGVDVRNLRHLVTIIEGTKDDFVRIDIDRSRVIIISRKDAIRINTQTMRENCITHDRSEDLRETEDDQKDDVAKAAESTAEEVAKPTDATAKQPPLDAVQSTPPDNKATTTDITQPNAEVAAPAQPTPDDKPSEAS